MIHSFSFHNFLKLLLCEFALADAKHILCSIIWLSGGPVNTVNICYPCTLFSLKLIFIVYWVVHKSTVDFLLVRTGKK